jgi:hypothetical protein
VSRITVEDRVLIRELYDRFYMGLNDADEAAIQACFAPGGHITRYDGEPSTPEFAAATGRAWNADPIGATYQHHVTNVVVDPDPDGRDEYCLARMYFLVTGVYEPPRIIVRWSCSARDVLRRVDGEWRFHQRQISLNHDATGPHWDGEPPHPDWDFARNAPPVAG